MFIDDDDYIPSTDDPLVKAFYYKFGGEFYLEMSSGLVYTKQDKTYSLPKTKMEFFDKLSQSIKTGNNLFIINTSIDFDLPEGAVY